MCAYGKIFAPPRWFYLLMGISSLITDSNKSAFPLAITNIENSQYARGALPPTLKKYVCAFVAQITKTIAGAGRLGSPAGVFFWVLFFFAREKEKCRALSRRH
jgi:hypothetical protein